MTTSFFRISTAQQRGDYDMSAQLDSIQEKRDLLFGQLQEARKKFDHEKNGWDSAESEENFKKLSDDISATEAELVTARDRFAKAAEMDAMLDKFKQEQKRGINPHGLGFGKRDALDPKTELQKELAFRGFLRGRRYASEDEKEAMRSTGMDFGDEVAITPEPATAGRFYAEIAKRQLFYSKSVESARRDLMSFDWESRTLSAMNFVKGGAGVNPLQAMGVEIDMTSYGTMRQAARTIVTTGGEPLPIPTVSDIANSGSWIGESTAGTAADPSFNQVMLYAHKCTSNPVLVPEELLQDAGFDLSGYLMEALARRINVTTEAAFAQGDGAGKPYGLLTKASQVVEAASQTAFTRSEIERLVYSVDPAYRNQPGAGFMMHDAIMAQCRILTDSNGVFLWVNGTDPNMTEQLRCGGKTYPVFINQAFPSTMTISTKIIAFGQLTKYYIRRAGQVRMYRMNERYRDVDQTGFVAFERVDGNLIDAGTDPIKYLQLKTS